jgi:hypothetical protein
MSHSDFTVLDRDIHVVEPPDLRQRYIDPGVRDRATQGLTEDVGGLRLVRRDDGAASDGLWA